jgi:putative metallopeptidase DUF4344
MTTIARWLGCCAIAAAVWATPALAAKGKPPKSAVQTNRIRIAYVAPKNAAHQQLHDALKSAQVLEKMQAFLSPLRLPRDLLLKLEGCDGVSNAWYDEGAVTVCYEYLADIWKNANSETRPPKVSQRSAVVGPVFDVFLHEVGHALFDIFQVPILGREEDAADAVSSYVMLQFGPDESRELVKGAVYSYAADLKITDGTQLANMQISQKVEKFADEHGIPAQRLYTLLCVAYGADPKNFAAAVEDKWLPTSRAEGCEFEYQQIAYAYRTLILPHVDPKLAKQVRAKTWLPAVSAKPEFRPQTAAPKSP